MVHGVTQAFGLHPEPLGVLLPEKSTTWQTQLWPLRPSPKSTFWKFFLTLVFAQ